MMLTVPDIFSKITLVSSQLDSSIWNVFCHLLLLEPYNFVGEAYHVRQLRCCASPDDRRYEN